MGIEGLDCNDGKHLLIADSPDEFAGAIKRLLTDKDLAQRLRKNARQLMEKRYSWGIHSRQFADLVEQVALVDTNQIRLVSPA
jgi:glycosyltransferase involved in cell wall biosynthesis